MLGCRGPKGVVERGSPAERGEGREERGSPAEAAARDREGRDTPKSEGRREEDEKGFGTMGREGKFFWEKTLDKRGDWRGGNLRGRRTRVTMEK